MGVVSKLKGMVHHDDDQGEHEHGQSSSLPPAGEKGPPEPKFEGPGGPEAPHNGGEAKYERVDQESAADAARRRMEIPNDAKDPE
ncbi:hypothetical protein JCM8202_005204 [Rhodotorula sphaerocarpa]